MKKNYSWGIPFLLNTNRLRRPSAPSNVLPTATRLQAQREGTGAPMSCPMSPPDWIVVKPQRAGRRRCWWCLPSPQEPRREFHGGNYYKRGVGNPAVHPCLPLAGRAALLLVNDDDSRTIRSFEGWRGAGLFVFPPDALLSPLS